MSIKSIKNYLEIQKRKKKYKKENQDAALPEVLNSSLECDLDHLKKYDFSQKEKKTNNENNIEKRFQVILYFYSAQSLGYN